MSNKKLGTCQYCGKPLEYAKGKLVYMTPAYAQINIVVCSGYPECDSYVGCHTGTLIPMGSVANSELRALRRLTHEVFDHQWETGRISRARAYKEMSKIKGLEPFHIGEFTKEQCELLISTIKGETATVTLEDFSFGAMEDLDTRAN